MLFTTPVFLFLFLPLFLLIYYFTPSKGQSRNFVALIASILFFHGVSLFMFFVINACFY